MTAHSHTGFATAQWESADFWRQLAPGLHVDDPAFQRATGRFAIGEEESAALRVAARTEGYFERRPREWPLPIAAMAHIINQLVAQGIPAPFAYAYDEFWLLFRQLDAMIGAVLGNGYQRLPDFWAWHVDPRKEQAGWKPHRDKDWTALHADRTPRALSVWVSLTDTTPLNGCIYLLPADRDPNYGTAQDTVWDFDLADIRALPAAAGTVFMWSQAVLHWGARASPRARAPRISIAMEFQDAVSEPFNTPLSDPRAIPGFAARMQLIGKQILQYDHMYPLSDEVRDLAQRLSG